MLSFDCAAFRARCYRSRAFSVINMSKTFWCFSSCLFSLTEHKPSILLCAKGKKDNWWCRPEPYCGDNSAIFPSACASCRLLQWKGDYGHLHLLDKDKDRRDSKWIKHTWDIGWKRLRMSGCATPFCTMTIIMIIIMTSATASVTSRGIFHPLYYVSAFYLCFCALSRHLIRLY